MHQQLAQDSNFRITLAGCDFGGGSKKPQRQENSLVLNRNGNCEFDTRGLAEHKMTVTDLG